MSLHHALSLRHRMAIGIAIMSLAMTLASYGPLEHARSGYIVASS